MLAATLLDNRYVPANWYCYTASGDYLVLFGRGVFPFHKGYKQNNRQLLAFCLYYCAYYWDLEISLARKMSDFYYLAQAVVLKMYLSYSGREGYVNLFLLLRWDLSIKNARKGKSSEVVFFKTRGLCKQGTEVFFLLFTGGMVFIMVMRSTAYLLFPATLSGFIGGT